MEVRTKISKKLLNRVLRTKSKGELEEILTEEVNKRYLEYLDKEFKKQCKGESKIHPKGFLSIEAQNENQGMF